MRQRARFDMSTLDPSDPDSIARLIAFHRTRHGSAVMEDDPPQDPPPQDPPADDKGFPADTPIAQMTPEQQTAYWRFQAKKHEKTAKSRADYDDLKKAKDELEELKRQGLTDQEKALEEARAQARTEAESAATVKYAGRVVGAELKAALAEKKVPAAQAKSLVEFLDHTKFLTPDGEVDTDKVTAYADGVATTGTNWPDTGGGDRGKAPATGRDADREAGLAEAQKRYGKKN